tara:strand:- start:102 stop:284 length:183 start_codon:yes stop_codon:yes gene_type:complete
VDTYLAAKQKLSQLKQITVANLKWITSSPYPKEGLTTLKTYKSYAGAVIKKNVKKIDVKL